MSDMIQFVAQLTVDVGRRDSQIRRALQVLQKVSKPKWCQWCGSAQSGTDGDDILFACGSWHSGSTPEYQWVQCKLNVAEQRIRRALEVLQKAARYDCDLSADNEILYLDSPLGAVTDSVDVDRAIQILQEGQQ